MRGVLEELKLSRGEERVLLLTLQGKLDKEVAAELGLSLFTVRSFWRRIRAKVGGASRAEVLARVARMSLERELGEQVSENERLLGEIARRREAETEATQRARLLDLAHDAILVWQIGGGILYWNKGAEDLYGHTAEEALGLSPHELLKTQFPVSADQAELSVVRHGSWAGILSHTTKLGEHVVVESRQTLVREEGLPLSVMETNRDVTRRVETEAHLQIYRKAFEHARVGLAVDDGEKLTYVNEAFAHMHGYETGELAGVPIFRLFTPEERRNSHEVEDAISARGEATLSEIHVRKDGSEFPVVKQITVVRGEDGGVLFRTVTVIDSECIETWQELLRSVGVPERRAVREEG